MQPLLMSLQLCKLCQPLPTAHHPCMPHPIQCQQTGNLLSPLQKAICLMPAIFSSELPSPHKKVHLAFPSPNLRIADSVNVKGHSSSTIPFYGSSQGSHSIKYPLLLVSARHLSPNTPPLKAPLAHFPPSKK